MESDDIPPQVRTKIERDWDEGTISELMAKIREGLKKMDRGKLESLLRGNIVSLVSDETNAQKPEDFTKKHIIIPLLRYLGYSEEDLDEEALKKRIRLGENSTRRYPDYRAHGVYGDVVLIEAESLGKNLWGEKKHGVHQVADWMDYKTRIGVATNGLKFVLIYYVDSANIEVIKEVDLSEFFQKLWNPQVFVEDKEIKGIFEEFYFYFSKRWISVAVKMGTNALAMQKEELTNKFYSEFLKITFGYAEKKSRIVEKGDGLINYVDAPATAGEIDKRNFVVLFMNRLIFIVFLEDIGLVPPRLLSELYEAWESQSLHARGFYEEYLVSLFYSVLNTEPEMRDTHIQENELFKQIPYLNGGLFRKNLPDEDKYKITNDQKIKEAIDLLEGKNLRVKGGDNNALNPDVLGHIYEKLINLLTNKGQKGLGAYYTPDNITGFMSRESVEREIVKKLKKVLERWGGFSLDFDTLDEALDIEHPVVRDERILDEVLDEISTIRVLDPAVGSGHFLLSVLSTILDARRRIHNLTGEEFDPYKEKLDIVLNNLCGVDIDGSAVEITKLRLWLALIEDIDVEKVRTGELVLPNVEYNVRRGNSLVGLLREEITFTNLSMVFDEKMEHLFAGLRVNAQGEEKKNIAEAERLLNSNSGNVLENYVSAYQKIYEIYRSSTGEKAVMMKDILEKIRSAIYREATPAYVRYYYPKLSGGRNVGRFQRKLKEVEAQIPFHWVVDFGWIIRDGGFDVVIGNPPHGASVGKQEKKMWDLKYTLIQRSHESAKVFVERGFELLRDYGVLGFVIPKASSYSFAWSDYRDCIYNYQVLYHIDLGVAFKGVKHEQVVIIVAKEDGNYCKYKGGYFEKNHEKIEITGAISQEIFKDRAILPCNINEAELEIFEHISNRGPPNMDNFDVFRGLPRRLACDDGEKCVKGKEIGRYFLKPLESKVLANPNDNKVTRLRNKKVIVQRIVAHVTNPINRIIIMAYPDFEGVLTFETVTNIVPTAEEDIVPVTVLLNSTFLNWYVYLFLYNRAIRDMDFDAYYVKRIPLPERSAMRRVLRLPGEYMVFLKRYESQRSVGDRISKYFELLIDCLVFELYLGDKIGTAVTDIVNGVEFPELDPSKGDDENYMVLDDLHNMLASNSELENAIDKLCENEWVTTVIKSLYRDKLDKK